MRHRLSLLFFLLGGISFCAAAVAPSTEDQEPKPIKVSTVPYTIAKLDKVLVTGSDDSVQTYQVSQDGLITLGDKSYRAEGLAPGELTHLVKQHLSGASSISIEEFRANRVTVLGEVFHQIFTEMSDGPMRVLDAIASANGFTPLANTRRVKLVRENAGRVEVYELDLRDVMLGHKSNQNMLVKPGDVITVPKNFL
jgi:protein involved in polysaccharide export with SLBB domain